MSSSLRRRARALGLGILALLVLGLVGLLLWRARPPSAGDGAQKVDAGAAGAATATGPRIGRTGAGTFTPPATEQLELTGRVIDGAGAPAPGAMVLLTGPVQRGIIADGAGGFRFSGLYPDSYLVEAHRGDGAGGPLRVHLRAGTPPVTIRLFEAARLVVNVVRVEGNTKVPVPDASVELRVVGMMRNRAIVRQGKTDASGRAELRGVPPDGYVVIAWAQGYRHAAGFLEPPAGLRWETTLTLQRGSDVHGRVVDEQNHPVAGATIIASQEGPGGGVLLSRPPAFSFSPRSDAEGRFVLSAVSAGSWQLMADSPDYTLGWSERFSADGRSPVRNVVIRVTRGAAISGRVVTARGEPVPRAVVRLGPRDMQVGGGSTREVYADVEGRFRCGGLPKVEMEVVAMADGASSDTFVADLKARPDYTGAVIPLTFEGVISGRVIGTDRRPIADAQVVCLSVRNEAVGIRPFLPETTDANGHFECRGLPPGHYQVNAQRPGPNHNIHAGLRGAGAQADVGGEVEIVIPEDGSLRGRALLPDQRPATKFGVALVKGLVPRPFDSPDGVFIMDGLAPGTYELTLTADGFPPKKAMVRVREGLETDVGDLVLSKEPPPDGGAPVRPGVRYPNGRLVEGLSAPPDVKPAAPGLRPGQALPGTPPPPGAKPLPPSTEPPLPVPTGPPPEVPPLPLPPGAPPR